LPVIAGLWVGSRFARVRNSLTARAALAVAALFVVVLVQFLGFYLGALFWVENASAGSNPPATLPELALGFAFYALFGLIISGPPMVIGALLGYLGSRVGSGPARRL